MKKQLKVCLLATVFVAMGVPMAQAAKVEVQWDDPATYRDIRSTTTTQKKFEARVLSELETFFVKAGETLPENQTLKLQIHDVDLAGYINYFYRFNTNGVREVRNIDGPRINLHYELVNDAGEVLQSGVEKLKDQGFNIAYYSNLYHARNASFPYEKKMIEDWYRESF